MSKHTFLNVNACKAFKCCALLCKLSLRATAEVFNVLALRPEDTNLTSFILEGIDKAQSAQYFSIQNLIALKIALESQLTACAESHCSAKEEGGTEVPQPE